MKLDEGFVCGSAVAWKSSKDLVLKHIYVKLYPNYKSLLDLRY